MLKFIIKKQLDYKHKYYSKGWHLSIYKYSFYVWGCKQQARNADEWQALRSYNRWWLVVSLMRCRVPFVHELLWLTVGWSKLANCAVRLERSSSIERKLLWSRRQQNTAGPIKRPSSLTNTLLHNITGSVASCYKAHRLYLSTTTKLRGFIHDYNASFYSSSILPSKHLSTVVCDVIN